MPVLTIRNLSKSTLRALEARAARHGRSTEAEIQHILESAIQQQPAGLGTRLAEIGRAVNGVDLRSARDSAAVDPARFE